MTTQTHDSMWKYIELHRRRCEQLITLNGCQPTAFTHHYGCQQNVSDGEKLDGMLLEMGYAFCESAENADLVLFNTCAVRENAEDRIFGNVGALKHAKRQNPGMVIGLCGCMVQQGHMAEKFRTSYPHVDLLFGPSSIAKFPELLWKRLESGGRVFEISDATGEIAEDLPIRREGKIRAFIPIMYGCDNFCSYCVVPLVRGRERSRGHGAILGEMKELVQSGYREITLLGQNVNSYMSGEVDFAALLRLLNDVPGEFRIRFMTSHPKDCSYELIDTIAQCGKVCNHLHLPVQSGSDRILEQMNRGYTARQYLDVIEYAKKKIPGITFTSDVIVGFPGEEYEDVKETIGLIKKVRYLSLFTFLYSKREGTAAAQMEDIIPDGEKKRYFTELLDMQNAISKSMFEEFIGQTLVVLADGRGKAGEGYLTGRSVSNLIVDFEAPDEFIGKFVKVKITRALHWALAGEMI